MRFLGNMVIAMVMLVAIGLFVYTVTGVVKSTMISIAAADPDVRKYMQRCMTRFSEDRCAELVRWKVNLDEVRDATVPSR